MGEKLTRRDAIRAGLGAAIMAALAPALGALRPVRELVVGEPQYLEQWSVDWKWTKAEWVFSYPAEVNEAWLNGTLRIAKNLTHTHQEIP